MTNSDKMLDEMKRSWEASQGIGEPLPKDDPVQQAIDQVRQEKQDAGHHWANPRENCPDHEPATYVLEGGVKRVPKEPASSETIQKMLETDLSSIGKPSKDLEGERRREIALQAALQISHSDISASHLIERAIEIEQYLASGKEASPPRAT